jgi:hypothetical protein
MTIVRPETPMTPSTTDDQHPQRTWTITATNGVSASGYLPAWAAVDPSQTNVQPDHMMNRLDDVTHIKWYSGQLIERTDLPDETGRYTGPTAILCPQIDVDPFDEDPVNRIPTATVEIIEGWDCWIPGLGPEGAHALADQLRAQAAVLDQVGDDLAAYRADWAANGGTR